MGPKLLGHETLEGGDLDAPLHAALDLRSERQEGRSGEKGAGEGDACAT